MTAPRPGMADLWYQAGEDPERYRALLREHHILLSPGDPGYGDGVRSLPCGWPGPSHGQPGHACRPGCPGAECIHDLDPASCSVCSGRDKEPPEERGPLGPVFAARYGGKCSGCGDGFGEGDRIRADGTGRSYLHERCEP